MFDLIASHIRYYASIGCPGGTLEITSDGVRNFSPMLGLYSFAIGGDGTPEKKVKRVTARVLRAWLAPHHGPDIVPRFVGWWLEDGVIVLDVPTVWSGTDYDATRAKAEEIGRARGERAIYDFHNGEDIEL